MGFKGARIREVQINSRAYVDLTKSQSDEKRTNLTICGKKENIECALNLVNSSIFDFYRPKMKARNEHFSFRKAVIKLKTHEVCFIDNEEGYYSPQCFFLDFKPHLNENEEIYVPQEVDYERKPPLHISKYCAILAPYNGYMYRALVLEAYDYGNVAMHC